MRTMAWLGWLSAGLLSAGVLLLCAAPAAGRPFDGALDDPRSYLVAEAGAAFPPSQDGVAARDLSRYARALDLFLAGAGEDAARAAEPLAGGTAAARNLLGAALGLSGDREGAKRNFRRAIEADPKGLDPYVNLGLLLHHDKAWEGLARLSRRLETENPASGDHLLGLGLAAYGRRDFAEAARLLALARDAMERADNPRAAVAREYLQRADATRRRVFTRPDAP